MLMATPPTSKFKPSLTEEQRQQALALRLALEPFRKINPSMPISYLNAFLEVALDEGKGVAEYAQKLNVAHTVMTRNLLDIGMRNRKREEGYDLIVQERDVWDLRKHNARLTAKGVALINDIGRALQTLRGKKGEG